MLGFIGLGMIGRPMARRLAETHKGVQVYDVSAEACAALNDVAQTARSPAAMGRDCTHVAICVRNDDDVRAVLQGDDGLLKNARPGLIVAIHSTIGLENLLAFAAEARTHNVELVDVAVTGGPNVAAKGQLTAMIGGASGIAERLQPLIGAYCANLVHAGPVGAGMKLKVANNLVTYTQLAIGVEAARLAARSGVDPDQLIAVMKANGNLTTAMGAYLAGRKMLASNPENFVNFQKGLANLAEKDLDHALETGAACGDDLPLGHQTRALFRNIIERMDQ
jgi:3-hydroxyisobutyrate dehydrogenase